MGVSTPSVNSIASRIRLELSITLEKDKGAGEPAPFGFSDLAG
jgi:hypothetical protein